jgi:plasmid maintenance system antidote protein VapI
MQQERRYSAPRLRETLRQQGRSGRWLARQVGIHESQLSRSYTGKQPLPESVAGRIASLIGVEFSMLFDLHTSMESMQENIGEAA